MNLDLTIMDFNNSRKNLKSTTVEKLLDPRRTEIIESIREDLSNYLEVFETLPSPLRNKTRISLTGGCIRDFLVSEDVKDLDIVISVPSKAEINQDLIDLYKKLPISDRNTFRENLRDYLSDNNVIFKNQPINEKEMWKYLIENLSKSIYSFSDDGNWDLDKMFSDLETEEQLREMYEPKNVGGGVPYAKKLVSVNYNTTSMKFFTFLLSTYLRNTLSEENRINEFDKSEEFFTNDAIAVKEKEYLTLLNTKAPPNASSSTLDSFYETQDEDHRRILGYASIKGVLKILKVIPKEKGFQKDLIFSFVDADSFVSSFDINLLKNHLSINKENLSSNKSFVENICFTEASSNGYINKELVYTFIGDELENKLENNRFHRYEKRIMKNMEKFPDFEFSTNFSGYKNLDIYKKYPDGTVSSYSKSELDAKKMDIDTYSLLVSFTLNIMLNMKQNKCLNITESTSTKEFKL